MVTLPYYTTLHNLRRRATYVSLDVTTTIAALFKKKNNFLSISHSLGVWFITCGQLMSVRFS